MDWPLTMVLVLLGVAMVLFVTGRPRMDVVAVIMMLALPLTGVVSMAEALMGFADPNIVLIAALFVIGEALVRTGVAQRLGDGLTARAGASEGRVIVLLMLVAIGCACCRVRRWPGRGWMCWICAPARGSASSPSNAGAAIGAT